MRFENYTFFFLLSFLLCTRSLCFSQINDASIWCSTTLEKELTKKTTTTFTQEFRLDENLSELGTFFSDFGIEQELAKKFSIGLNYRYINRKRIDDFYSKRHRLYTDISYKHKFEKIIFNYRMRAEAQYNHVNFAQNDISSGSDGFKARNRIRNKVQIKLNTENKLKPFASIELFNYPRNYQYDLRYIIGFDYKLNKKIAPSIYYQINREYNVKNYYTDFTTGLSLKYSL